MDFCTAILLDCGPALVLIEDVYQYHTTNYMKHRNHQTKLNEPCESQTNRNSIEALNKKEHKSDVMSLAPKAEDLLTPKTEVKVVSMSSSNSCEPSSGPVNISPNESDLLHSGQLSGFPTSGQSLFKGLKHNSPGSGAGSSLSGSYVSVNEPQYDEQALNKKRKHKNSNTNLAPKTQDQLTTKTEVSANSSNSCQPSSVPVKIGAGESGLLQSRPQSGLLTSSQSSSKDLKQNVPHSDDNSSSSSGCVSLNESQFDKAFHKKKKHRSCTMNLAPKTEDQLTPKTEVIAGSSNSCQPSLVPAKLSPGESGLLQSRPVSISPMPAQSLNKDLMDNSVDSDAISFKSGRYVSLNELHYDENSMDISEYCQSASVPVNMSYDEYDMMLESTPQRVLSRMSSRSSSPETHYVPSSPEIRSSSRGSSACESNYCPSSVSLRSGSHNSPINVDHKSEDGVTYHKENIDISKNCRPASEPANLKYAEYDMLVLYRPRWVHSSMSSSPESSVVSPISQPSGSESPNSVTQTNGHTISRSSLSSTSPVLDQAPVTVPAMNGTPKSESSTPEWNSVQDKSPMNGSPKGESFSRKTSPVPDQSSSGSPVSVSTMDGSPKSESSSSETSPGSDRSLSKDFIQAPGLDSNPSSSAPHVSADDVT